MSLKGLLYSTHSVVIRMNKSALMHSVYAVAFQTSLIGLYLATNSVVFIAGIGAALFFLGREHAQREYKITHGGSVKELDALDGFKGWSKDASQDFFYPLLTVSIVSIVYEIFKQ